jgi:hypothetical protein
VKTPPPERSGESESSKITDDLRTDIEYSTIHVDGGLFGLWRDCLAN